MPLLHHPVIGPLAGDGEAIELTGETDSEVADVDHLLHFTLAFRRNFSSLDGHQTSKRCFRATQLFAENANKLTSLCCGDGPPFEECRLRSRNRLGHSVTACILHVSNRFAGQWRSHRTRTLAVMIARNAELLEKTIHIVRNCLRKRLLDGHGVSPSGTPKFTRPSDITQSTW